MPFLPRYATLRDLRRRGILQSFMDDPTAQEALDDVSRWVEEFTEQIFYPRPELIELNGQFHRVLSHPSLWPILSDVADITIEQLTSRTRQSTLLDIDRMATTVTYDNDWFSMRTNHPRRYIDMHQGVWDEGSHNYQVTATWGWMQQILKVEFTLAADVDPGDEWITLTSVTGLRVNDMCVLPDGTVVTVVSVDVPNLRIGVEGLDLLLATQVSGLTLTRWGKVPTGIRNFVIEAIWMKSGASDCGSGSCSWIRREKTDTYEYEKFTPEEMGLDNGNFWTGDPMIDQGLVRFRRPTYIGMV